MVALMSMRILVVIPVFNRPAMVLEALDSVAVQSIPPTAVVVVDDGSTDGTAEVVERWIAANPGLTVHLVRANHGGASAARNLGLRMFAGDMDAVVFLDSDDLWPSDLLERASSLLEREPRAVAVSTDRELHDLNLGSRRKIDTTSLEVNPWFFMLRRGGALGSCTMFRIPAVQEAGGYPEDIPTGHDKILFGRIARLGSWHHITGNPVVFRRNYAVALDGDADHLHSQYPDYQARWALAAEQLWREAPNTASLNLKARILICKRWSKATKQAIRCGNRGDAWRCLARAFRFCPWRLNNLHLLFRLMGRAKR